jgi:hypothetical protein
MRRLSFVIAALLCGWLAARAEAQEACKMEQLKDPKLTLADMYARAEAKAKAWKPDAVPVNIGNTSMGPLDEQGRSEAWALNFYSKTANQNVSITTFRGMFNCFASAGAAGRIPDLKPDFFRDGAKLYGVAKQHGAALLSQGYIVMLATSAAPSTRHAMWYLNFSKPDGASGNLTVIVDANTGALEKVIK